MRVDQELPSVGITAVFGASGAGKTTLLRAIAGLESLEGRVQLDAEVWQDNAAGQWTPPSQRGIGFVFQGGGLFDHLTVRGNLGYGFARRRGRASRLTQTEVIALLRLEPLLSSHPRQLSAGQRQRVALARSLLSAPRLLLLDEPLANLDLAARQEILSVLERVSRESPEGAGMPIVYVTHSWAEVERLASQAVLLEDGRVTAFGEPADLAGAIDPDGNWETEVGVVLDAEVVRHHPEDRLTELSFSGGCLLVPQKELSPGTRRRVRLLARDVSLTLDRTSGTSILNILPARVVEIRRANSSQPLVVLDLGGHDLLARITYRSLQSLRLSPGRKVWAQVKGVALIP